MWSDAYDFPLQESVKIFEFDLRFPWGTRSRRSVSLVAEFDWDIGSLHQYTQVIVLEILRFGVMHMTSHCWNLSKFLNLTCIFEGALGREVQSPLQPLYSRGQSGHWRSPLVSCLVCSLPESQDRFLSVKSIVFDRFNLTMAHLFAWGQVNFNSFLQNSAPVQRAW